MKHADFPRVPMAKLKNQNHTRVSILVHIDLFSPIDFLSFRKSVFAWPERW